MGEVWLGEHVLLGRCAAIKLLQPEFAKNREIVRRFFNEARAATTIADPGVVQIFDCGRHYDGSTYIVMELLEGETLGARIRALGALVSMSALHIMRQIAGSVGAAHAHGIIHLDLKPDNVFLVRDPAVLGGERAKILDFGIAKRVGDLSVQTQISAVMGTPAFMSPEQCRGSGRVDQRSDVYALGCVLYAMVTGEPPFDADELAELIARKLREPAPRASSRAPDVPPVLDELIARCLDQDPERRFGSGTELAVAIDVLLDGAASCGRWRRKHGGTRQ